MDAQGYPIQEDRSMQNTVLVAVDEDEQSAYAPMPTCPSGYKADYSAHYSACNRLGQPGFDIPEESNAFQSLAAAAATENEAINEAAVGDDDDDDEDTEMGDGDTARAAIDNSSEALLTESKIVMDGPPDEKCGNGLFMGLGGVQWGGIIVTTAVVLGAAYYYYQQRQKSQRPPL